MFEYPSNVTVKASKNFEGKTQFSVDCQNNHATITYCKHTLLIIEQF